MQKTNRQSKPAQREMPLWRRRCYKLILVALPLLLLFAVEIGLRLGGYGYETEFFLKRDISGQAVLTSNPRFGWRFFPPAIARTPQPMRFTLEKPPGTLRVVVLGESAAMGDPEPAYGMARMLEVILSEALPGKKIEVINAAATAINSHAVREIARDCQALDADFWVVYMGNNEVVGPFGAGTVFGPRAPSLGLIRATLFLRTLRLGQWVDALRHKWYPPPTQSWEGMEMFLKNLVATDDPQLAVVHRHFERNLRDILDQAEAARARVLLCTVGVNIRDCAPFASEHRPGLSPERWKTFDELRRQASEAVREGNHDAGIKFSTEALAISPKHAETLYLRGQSWLAQTNAAAARTDLEAAKELDALRFRADSRLNQIIRESAQKRSSPNISLVEIAGLLSTNSPAQLPGRELFWEHVHLNFAGNYAVARALAEQVVATRSSKGSTPAKPYWLTQEETAQRLAFTEWAHYQVAAQIRKRLEQAPFTAQLDHARQLAFINNRIAALHPQTKMEALKNQRDIYVRALAARTNDWVLDEQYAGFLEALGDTAAAREQWQRVAQLLPDYAEAQFRLGNLADQAGQSAEAEAHFRQAIRLRSDSPEIWNGLGLSLLAQNKLPEAAESFQTVLRLRSHFPAAEVNLALTLARQGQRAAAHEHFLAALRLQSNYVAAHVNLGKFLKAEGKTNEALAHYETAAQLQPDDPVVRFNLANTLAEAGRAKESLPHYEAAIAANTNFAEAHLNYGLELARLGRDEEAITQMRAAARLAPQSGEARLNYGVALARRKYWGEAREEFMAASKLRPQDPAPLANLGAVLAALNQRDAARQALEAALRLDPNHAAARRYLEQLK